MDNPTPTPCTVDGCEKPVSVKSRGLCQMHYMRASRSGEIGEAGLLKVRQSGPCSAEGCDEPAKSKGLCSKHYQRSWRHGSLEDRPGARTKHATCTVDGCERPHHARGYCSLHRGRAALGIPLDAPPLKTPRAGTCEGPECDRPILAKRLCTGHYAQKYTNGVELTPIRVPGEVGPCEAKGCDRLGVKAGMCETHRRRWLKGDPKWDRPIPLKAANGTGYINKDGYRIISVNGKRTFEHRHVASLALGRPLESHEEVHHRNGDRADNRVDGPFRLNHRGHYVSGNLEIWSTSQPAGQEIGPKVEWALEILALYAPEKLA